MALNKYARQLFSQLNKALNEWENLGVKPNAVRHAENLIESFYEWAGKNPKEKDRLSTQLKLNEEQTEELIEIGKSIASMDIFVGDKYKEQFLKAFETVRASGKHGIETIEDYQKFVDAKERFAQNKLIGSIISYYEYERLLQKARRKNKSFTEKQLNEKIIELYRKTGYEGEGLYEFVYKNL